MNNRTSHSRILAPALLVFALLAPSVASAQIGEGAFRLSADFSLFGIFHSPPNDPAILAGFSTTSLAPVSAVGIGLGYQVIENLMIGARVGAGVVALPTGLGRTATLGQLGILPFLEGIFLDGDFRPFVGAQGGVLGIFGDGFDAQVIGLAGGYGGVHCMATDSFSVSPGLQVDFVYSGASKQAGYEVLLTLEIAGWIGGHRAVTTTADTLP